MYRNSEPYDRSVRSLNNADRYDISGESEYSRERSNPYQMVDYMIDREVNFRGRGPKGWWPSDERICDEVSEILARDSRIDATLIEVEVENGSVYLKGKVPDRRTKRLSEIVLDDLPGIRDIFNQLSFR